MSISEKLRKRHPTKPYDEWKRSLRRQFWGVVLGVSVSWIAAGLFTVWLLKGVMRHG